MWKEVAYFAFLVLPTLGSDAPCVDIGGTCQEDSLSCPGGYQSGLCSGGANRRCCRGSDTPCLYMGGTCQYDFLWCPGVYLSGFCGGGFNRRCCVRGIPA